MTELVRGKPLRPCGTYAAYQRHVRHREPIDAACRAANTAHVAAWRSDQAQEELHRCRAADLRAVTDGESA